MKPDSKAARRVSFMMNKAGSTKSLLHGIDPADIVSAHLLATCLPKCHVISFTIWYPRFPPPQSDGQEDSADDKNAELPTVHGIEAEDMRCLALISHNHMKPAMQDCSPVQTRGILVA